jgi:hypothetical protein
MYKIKEGESAMQKIKGIAQLENTINNFLERFELVGKLDADFSYEFNTHTVNYSVVVSDMGSKYFQEFVHAAWPELKSIDTFLISLLHEVGHAETWDFLDEMDIAYADDVKASIEDELADGVTEARKKALYFEYFSLPDEYAATEWAIEYLKKHTAQMDLAWTQMSNAIVEFFKTNNIQYN